MNNHEIDRVAAMGNALRPDWPVSSLRTLLSGPKLVNRPRRDVAVALAWVACESVTTTPARVIEDGPWWKAAATEDPNGNRWAPPKRDEECQVHPGQRANACGGCRADQLAGDTTNRPREAAPDDIRDRALEATYAAIAASKTTHTHAALAAEEES